MDDEVKPKGNPCGGMISSRYMLAVLLSCGMGIVYGLKVNLHVTIVSMVNHTHLKIMGTAGDHGDGGHNAAGDICPSELGVGNTTNGSAAAEDGPFIWPSTVQGLLLSAYFWSYIGAQLPGGRIAEVYSAKWVMFFAVAINVLCTLLTPVMANLQYGALILMRIVEGIGGGVTFPASHVLLAHWAPPSERSVMSSIVYAGTSLGTMVFMLMSGIIAGSLGWRAVFYIEGGAASIWLILWVILISDSPQKAIFITSDEREFIVDSLNQKGTETNHKKTTKIPWKSVFTSPAFFAILVAHTCSNWGWYVVLIELPLYMKTVLNFSLSQNTVFTTPPFMCMWIFSMVLSKTLDTLRAKKFITTTIARKIATGFASVVPMICFIILCYIGCRKTLSVVVMTIAIMCIGGMYCGFLSNHIDIAPNFAGTLMALTNTVATIPGIVVPVFVGQLTSQDPTIGSWRIIFWITGALYFVEFLVYILCGTGEEQKWNKTEEDSGETQPLNSNHKIIKKRLILCKRK